MFDAYTDVGLPGGIHLTWFTERWGALNALLDRNATGDAFAAATVSSLMNAAVLYRKMSASEEEKMALAATDISSNSGQLLVHFQSTDSQFDGLLKSTLFQSMVR